MLLILSLGFFGISLSKMSLKISDETSTDSWTDYQIFTIRSLKTSEWDFPLISINKIDAMARLSFLSAIPIQNLQVLAISDEQKALELIQDHHNRQFFKDLNKKALVCKEYFKDCESSTVNSQVFTIPLKNEDEQKMFLLYNFNQDAPLKVNMKTDFEVSIQVDAFTWDHYFGGSYFVIILVIVYNTFVALKHINHR